MHLTNYAINKSNAKFQFNQSEEDMDSGHKRSLSSILRRLDEQGHRSEQVWSEICGLITKTLISVQPTLAHHYRSCQPDNFGNNMCF
jgi:tubulin polyglutamylase TTLL6/13